MKQITLSFKKVGNHWYPDIKHEENYSIGLTSKLDRYLNILNKKINTSDKVSIIFKEVEFTDGGNILYIDNQDITRFMITDDTFLMKFRIDDKYFQISTDLYHLLEELYEFDFPNSLYTVHLTYNY